MVFNPRPGNLVRKAKDWAGQAISTAREAAPHMKQAADAARRSYDANSGLVDQYAGKHASAIHSGARRADDTFDSLERAAKTGDGALKSMGA